MIVLALIGATAVAGLIVLGLHWLGTNLSLKSSKEKQ